MRTSSAKPNFLPFLSTPSARRATGSGIAGSTDRRISIHALREEGDHPYSSWERGSNEFLSTPSARRAIIPRPHLLCWHHDFYPRPLRGGRPTSTDIHPAFRVFLSTPSARRATQSGKTCTCVPSNFYPRPPRGGRHAHISIPAPFAQFLSTPSARRATYKRTELEPSMDISIHALREEGDL